MTICGEEMSEARLAVSNKNHRIHISGSEMRHSASATVNVNSRMGNISFEIDSVSLAAAN